jgi:hypothetical protein
MATTIIPGQERHDMGLEEVSSILWRQRKLLELLLFKLQEEQLVLASGKSRWLTHATHEVEVVLEEIRHIEVRRAAEVDQLAGDLGLRANPTLRQLVEALDMPWKGIFEQHRAAFLIAAQEIQALADSNRELLTQGRRATDEALAWLSGGDQPAPTDVGIYSSRGSTTPVLRGPRLINRAL